MQNKSATAVLRSPFAVIERLNAVVQGNCSEPPDASDLPSVSATDPALLPLKAGQCLVIVSVPVWRAWSTNLWVDNIYIRLQRSDVCSSFLLPVLKQIVLRWSWPVCHLCQTEFWLWGCRSGCWASISCFLRYCDPLRYAMCALRCSGIVYHLCCQQ